LVYSVLLPLAALAAATYVSRTRPYSAVAVGAAALVAAAALTLVLVWGELCFLSTWCAGPNGGVGFLLAGVIALVVALGVGILAARAAARAYHTPKYRPWTLVAIVAVYVPAVLLWRMIIRDW
jgi:hypothetical protein